MAHRRIRKRRPFRICRSNTSCRRAGKLVAERKALAYDDAQLLHSRTEGEFLVSYATTGGWVAVTKDVLTEVLGAGRDAKIVGLPREAARVLQLMCPDFVRPRD